jgi:hypothetical protein
MIPAYCLPLEEEFMIRITSVILCALCACALSATAQDASAPELLEVTRIWDAAPHNAFTDLIRFEDQWICTFREGDGHVGGDGKIRILSSTDAVSWESAALLEKEGVDLRDPKLSITPDGRLMMLCGGSIYEGEKLITYHSRVAFSNDGRAWSEIHDVWKDGEWLWRVTWHLDTAYGIAYGKGIEGDWDIRLVSSLDGIHFEEVTSLETAGGPNETTLRMLPTGEMLALARRDGDGEESTALIGKSTWPFKEWTWTPTAHKVGGPDFEVLPDGSMWASGRSYPEGAKTVLARMTLDAYEPMLTLPSGGDTSYPGLVYHEGLLYLVYYASHEEKTSIYLAKIKLPE